MCNLKAKILFFLKVPPPVTGATMMNREILGSQRFRDEFLIDEITFNFARNNKDFGKFAFKKIGTFFSLIVKLLIRIQKNRPDIVYFQLSPFGVAFLRDLIYVGILKMSRLRILFHIRGRGIKKRAEKNLLMRILYKTAFRNEFLICFSNILAKDVEDVYSGVPYIVPNGIQKVVKEGEVEIRGEKAAIRILFISTYRQSKGILDFLEALGILKKGGFPVSAVFVGPENEFSIADLGKIARSMKIDDITVFTGAKYGSEKSEELKKADIFVFPTRNEAFGNVALEAMQFGLPVVASNEGSLPEIVLDGETGLLFEPGDSKMLAEKLIFLIENQDIRIRMGEAAQRRFFLEYTFEKFETKMTNVFHDVIKIISLKNVESH